MQHLMNRNLTETELSKVCEIITDNLGLNLPVVTWAILGRKLAVAAREAGFKSIDSFIHWILYSQQKEDKIRVLASHLTTTETYFWREPEVFKALTDYVLPGIISRNKREDNSINIWSTGCSTGEEPYSVAIALQQTIPDIKDRKIRIVATDINQKAISKALTGIYGPWSFRNTPEWIKKGYFTELEDKKFEIKPEIKEMVTFGNLNLAEDTYSFPAHNRVPFDIIFCRNVLMYFTEKWAGKISKNLFNYLSDEGWFIVSSVELSLPVFKQFKSVNFPGATLYRKMKNGSFNSLNNNSLPNEPLVEEKIRRVPEPIIRQISSSINQTIKPNLPTLIPPFFEYDSDFPEKPGHPKTFAIHLLANQGYLSEALSLCNKCIESEKLVPDLYFLRAEILQEMNNIPDAIVSLKQAIYLDPDFIMGHFALGNLFNRKGNRKSAIRYFNNVLDLIKSFSDEEILTDSDGLNNC